MARIPRKANERQSEDTEMYTGIARQFKDGTWGALCFELGLITRAETDEDALAQMTELIAFELECIKEGDPPTPATAELLEDFMTCGLEEIADDVYVSEPFPSRCFRIPAKPSRQLATA